MQLTFYIIPQDIINEYNLTKIASNGKVYINTQKGMHGLTQYGRIAHYIFKKHLYKYRYKPVEFIPVLWNQKSRPISVTLIFVNL